MEIQINSTRENDNDQTVFWTLTDDQENEYQWHGDIPKGVDVQGYLESNMKKYLLLIRKREYPDMPRFNTLEEIERWITDGCIVPEGISGDGGTVTPEYVAKKVVWTNKHPEPDRIELLESRIAALEAEIEK